MLEIGQPIQIVQELSYNRAEAEEDMGNWILPKYSKSEINKAGKMLTGEVWSLGLDESLEVINNWRSSHSYPLHIVNKTLKKRIKAVDEVALVSQRLKRLSSIAGKLSRFAEMQLARMQDIGGCRAVMNDISAVEKLTQYIIANNPEVRVYDYIGSPKNDGYRGIHFALLYQSVTENTRIWDGMRIEVQIRSQLQHAWATAVETVSSFTFQALKSGEGGKDWRRFFVLMGSAIATIENCPQVPNAPNRKRDLITEIRQLNKKLNIIDTLKGWGVAVSETAKMPDAQIFLLTLNIHTKMVTIRPYSKRQNKLASKEYLSTEQEFANDEKVQVVLVTVDSLANLRRAYPSYYSDTTEFVRCIEKVIEGNI